MRRLTLQLHRVTALLCALLLCAAWGMPAFAAEPAPYSGTAGDLEWSLSGGILTISGKGAIPDYTEETPAPWHPHRESVLRVQLDNKITVIGAMAFYEHAALTTISLPSSVETVGDMAFAGCESLVAIQMPKVTTLGAYAFSRCFALEDVVLPDTLTTIGNNAFYRCESLPYLHIPASVTTIGSSAFAYCDGLLRVDMDAAVEALPEWCFYGCRSLTVVTLPASVIEAGDAAFTRCEALNIVYYGGPDTAWTELSESIAESLPGFTVAQMAPIDADSSSVSGKDTVTDDQTVKETNTEIITEDEVLIRVDQTTTYPLSDNKDVSPEGYDTTIHATIRGDGGWDTLMDELRDQGNLRTSFEQEYGEQSPIQVDVTLQEDMLLSGDWLSQLSGTDAVVTVTTPNGSRFTFNGNHIAGYDFDKQYPLTYTLTAYTDVSANHRAVVGSAPCWWLSFDAAFAFPVTVDILLDSYAAHQTATLYENIKKDSLQCLQSARLDEEGYVSFHLSVINKTTRYLVAMNVSGTVTNEVVAPESDGLMELIPFEEKYEFAEPRGFMGMTMGEFTRFMLTVAGAFVAVVLALVLFFILRNKRRIKIARIRAEVMGEEFVLPTAGKVPQWLQKLGKKKK